MRKHLLNIVLILLAAFAASSRAAEPVQAKLTLDGFLESVQNGNQEYKASKEGEEAARLYWSEGSLVYSPRFISFAEYRDDAKPSFLPQFQYKTILTQNYSLGVAQQTPFGLQAKFTYGMSTTDYVGVNPYLAPYSEGRPTLELTQSLWRNDFGRETRAQVEFIRTKAKSEELSEGFNRQTQLIEAETAYWSLALMRQNLGLTKENMSRAEKIYGWAKRRVQLSLADRSDMLQATTVLQSRRLELRTAIDNERAASVNFNNARGVDSDQVPEALEPLTRELIVQLKIPERSGDRQDVLANLQRSEMLKAQAIISREKNQPDLELYGAYSFNSRERTKGDALAESWDGDKPTKVVGLRFNSPLAIGTMNNTQDGYAKQIRSAEYRIERQRFLQEQQWRDLTLRFAEAKERLLAADELEKTQREKLDYERDRQGRGRTTLFQVLTFESDYSNAQSVKIRTWAELLQIAAQMKLYGAK